MNTNNAPDKIYLGIQDMGSGYVYALSLDNNGEQEYIRKEALLKILTDLRDDAGVRDDQYEKDAILEYNLYDELINTVNEM